MKILLLTLALFISSCSIGQNFTTYTVYAGQTYPDPSLTGPVKDTLEVFIKLDTTWNQLYLSEDNSTHKITGVSDLLGRNSLRLGVRRALTKTNGLVAVNYYHKSGNFYYPALKDSANKNFILKYNTVYFIRVCKNASNWILEIYDSTKTYKLASAVDYITISSLGRRIQGPYIEVGSSPSPWTIKTDIQIIKN